MSLIKIIPVAFFVLFLNFNKSIAQYRLIKAHSDLEDRIISTDLGLVNTFRNYKQSPSFISPLIQMDSAIKIKKDEVLNFNQSGFNYFAWNNPEFSGNHRTSFTNGKWIKKIAAANLWRNPNRFFSWESMDREDYLVINPILDLAYSPKIGPFDTLISNGRGVELYGQMGDKISFHSQVFDYQYNYPFHLDVYRSQNNVYPGVGDVITNSFGLNDFFYATGYVDFMILKKKDSINNDEGYKISSTFGHDKQHIGSGFRSLILSNFSRPTLFLQINYQLGNFKYQNLFKELIRDMSWDESSAYNKKYLAMHRGSIEFKKAQLELGFTEIIIHSRPNNRFDLNYLNPIIFYKAVEKDLNSPDNTLIAFDAKLKRHNFLIYAQLLIDELRFSSVFKHRNEFRNKFGNQIGFYFNLKTPHLKQSYVQLEYNSVRPYTYSHFTNFSNYYAGYNQSMAHPLESNFRELVFRFFAIPKKFQRCVLKNTTQFAVKGLNKEGQNYGSDLRIPYTTAIDPDNALMLQGNRQNRINSMSTIVYYLQPNAKIELSHQWFNSLDESNRSNFHYLSLSIKYNFTDTRESYLF